MPLLPFYAHLLFRASVLLTAGLALVCLAGIVALGGALPGVELNELVARKVPEPAVARSGDAG